MEHIMADKTVFYIVRSSVDREHAEAFNRWYHEKHIPEILEFSGCKSARRFKALETQDKFTYMAVYEFENKEIFLKYQGSEEKKRLIEDYRVNFGDTSELKSSSWEQCYP
jgi:antibiotic biosynthesis monooxygenase (ABM) superfamily enzyme